MPGTTQRTRWGIFMEKIAVLFDDLPAKAEKARKIVSSQRHRVGNKSSIARPHVAICISIETDGIRIVCSDYAAAIVDLGAANKKAPSISPADLFRDQIKIKLFLI